MSAAVGLAQPETSTGSNLLAVDASGNATDALSSGSAVIANFYSAPSGHLYVLFNTTTPLVDGGTPCLLAEIALDTGVPSCIDDSLNSVNFSNMFGGQSAKPIQLDQSGNIFYQGYLSNGLKYLTYFDAPAICSTNRSQMEGFCGPYGSQVQSIYNFEETGTYAVAGYKGSSGVVLMQYYPIVEKQDSSISNVALSQGASGKIVLSGTSSEGYNITTVYDTKTKVETVVADASNEIEMYNITYIESMNKIMFNGLRFADNQFVVGEIALD